MRTKYIISRYVSISEYILVICVNAYSMNDRESIPSSRNSIQFNSRHVQTGNGERQDA